jgi:PAS domain S-box-containing protein
MRRLLEMLGYKLATARSSSAALNFAATNDFDVLVSDIGLPDVSGHELVRQVKKIRDVPAVAIIAHPVPEQLMVLDSHLRVRSVNKSFYAAFHVAPGQALGKELAELGNGQWNIPTLLTRLNELPNADGEFDDLELEHDFPAMGRRRMLVSARRLSCEDVQGGTILLSIRDCTQKRLEAEVGEILTRLRALTSMGKSIIIADSESRITFMNPAAEKLTGWAQNDALQKQVTDIFHIVNEQSTRTVEGPVEKVIREGVLSDLAGPTFLIDRNGGKWPIDGNAAPILDFSGRLSGVVLVFHDISNRRKIEQELEISELRYRRLFESAHDGILILDAGSAKVLDVNPFMADLLGYPKEHFLGKGAVGDWRLQGCRKLQGSDGDSTKARPIRYEDLPLQHKDGRHIPGRVRQQRLPGRQRECNSVQHSRHHRAQAPR